VTKSTSAHENANHQTEQPSNQTAASKFELTDAGNTAALVRGNNVPPLSEFFSFNRPR
jgi:hypothetical protein